MIRYSESTARAMWKLRMDGKTLREVAKAFGVSEATVGAWVARYVRSGGFEMVPDRKEAHPALLGESGKGLSPTRRGRAVSCGPRIETRLSDALDADPEPIREVLLANSGRNGVECLG